jgi:ADP-ribosyl-[dinitrogen reductase] hydrolase
MDLRARYRGSLLGLAAGDALGTPWEGLARNSFPPVSDLVGGGPRGLPVGAWTDDTSLALCLAESLVASRGFDARDQMDRYLRWLQDGHWSSTGYAYGIGHTMSMALARYELTRDPTSSGRKGAVAAGNGSLMRLAPVPLFFAENRADAVARSGESSVTTHANPIAVDACRYFGALVAGAAVGVEKEELLAEGFWSYGDLAPEIAKIAGGSFRRDEPPESSGYVVHTLEAALWAFARTETFREGALASVNLGDDTDTTAAVFGQLAGAVYGGEAIPATWLAVLARRREIERMADSLFFARLRAEG